MNQKLLVVSLLCAVMLAACGKQSKSEKTLHENLVFCESILPYNGGFLIGSFGTASLNPLNKEGKGYIVYANDTLSEIFIPATGALNAPKGMAIVDSTLYVADVDAIVAFDLNNPVAAPQITPMPAGENYVNDITVLNDSTLFVSVTNTGNIYQISLTDSVLVPVLYTNVPGANGILLDGNTLYVASYPADGVTNPNNVIYSIDVTQSIPMATPLTDRAGQYDGLALSTDKQFLYFSDWTDGVIGKINLKNGETTLVSTTLDLAGPADLTLYEGMLYVPDLPNSQVVVIAE